MSVEAFLRAEVFAYIVLAALIVEATGLFLLWRTRQKGLKPLEIISFLGAGASFSLALIVVATGQSIAFLGAALIAALVFHLIDMSQRWHR